MEEETIKIPHFEEPVEKLRWVQTNKKRIIAAKKAVLKKADGFAFTPKLPALAQKGYGVAKVLKQANGDDLKNADALRVKAVINTTFVMDSHDDVHIDGLWDKSLREYPMLMHLEAHNISDFRKIIADGEDLKAYTLTYSWKELGYDFEGNTQALEFDSLVKQERNSYMFGQYADGHVKNHSVGMRYVRLGLAIGNKEVATAEEYETYEKFINRIANKDVVEEQQYFWAVYEAKAIEGSAVPVGSNMFTPTNSVQAAQKAPAKAAAQKAQQDDFNLFMNL